MRIRKVTFKNFRSCSNLTIPLSETNILVGPNNSGKSTVINAFRLLAIAVQKARSSNPDLLYLNDQEQVWGYRFTDKHISISLESISTDYNSDPSEIQFLLDSGEILTLYFPEQNECIFFYSRDKFQKLSTAQFKSKFPLKIQVVPVLGPLRKEEDLLDPETVRNGLNSHVASLHFRNYWHKNRAGFDEFAKTIEATWPGMSIKAPEFIDGKLRMFCEENHILREIYNSGFGFQIWCQLLTHIGRGSDSSVVVIDEPEIYLHPDVQRQLIHILKDIGADFLLATHSVEIISESEPKDIIALNKKSQTAKRLNNVSGMQDAIKGIGSTMNITLTHLARTKKMVFVEGLEDYKTFQRFSKAVKLSEIGRGYDLTPIESNGFASWERIKEFAGLLSKAISEDFSIFAVYDRDYYPEELLSEITQKLAAEGVKVHFHSRKETENYLLEPLYLSLAINKQIVEKRLPIPKVNEEQILNLVLKLSDEFESDVHSQFIAKRIAYFERTRRDTSEVTKETMDIFKRRWKDPLARLAILPGKKVLAKLRDHFSSKGISLTTAKIVDSATETTIADDLKGLLTELDEFRKT